MKKILLTIIFAATLIGCGGDKPIPTSRLKQPVGDFSFVTPDGWNRMQKVYFKTVWGLQGVKITARRMDKKKLPLGTYQYVIKENDRVFVITCTCAEAVKDKYEPIFDQTMQTLETEK
jgi:hypothetical protein